MPLLKRKAFEKSSGLEFLRDDEEVFHCEITGEIFRDYEEYCERIILVNSMVWSCEMTGKPNLTYAEALESEKNARLSLRDFPMELRIPILYLASKTRRCTFAEMLDDVFNFVRDRYFVGETVEACLEGDSWSEGHVLSVTAPKQAPEVIVTIPGSPSKSSSLYSYEVEQFDTEEDGDGQGQVGIVSHDRVRRTRGIFTRDKNKLFLKQFVEQGPGGVIRIKEDAVMKYNINKVKFDQIFTGASPVFPTSKKFDKFTVNNMNNKGKLPNGQKKPNQKSHQQSMDKFVSKVDKFDSTKPKGMDANKDKLHKLDQKSGKVQKKQADEKTLKEEMKRVGEEMRQKKIEEKLMKRERSLKLAAYVKEWNKQKDDLELEDHKPLPQTIPIELAGIPNKYFGKFMAVLEFLDVFAKAIWLKDTFHGGVDVELLRRALTVREVAGPLFEICQMLLSAIFKLQEEEAEDCNEDKNLQNADDVKDNPENVDMNVDYGVHLATAASRWPQTYLATSLNQLPIDSQTFSEVLRLHLLSSGCNGGEQSVKWRYQQRGGYSSHSDPGLMLRIKKPHIIRALAKKHLTQLPISYKLKILDCLINQILSYATIRDIVEERIEKIRNLKNDIRNLQAAERKLEVELLLARQKVKRDAITKKEEEKLIGEQAVALDQETVTNLELLLKENDCKKAEYEKKFKNMQKEYFALQSYLGSDRAHRRYWLFESIPGLFIEHDRRLNGICNDKLVIPNPSLATAPPEDTLNYVQKLFESEHGGNSDKENDSENSILKKNHSEGNKSPKKIVPDQNALFQELLMCTSNTQTCPVHNTVVKTHWSFLHTSEHIDSLVDTLNKRGVREADLRQILESEKADIVKYISRCPASSLNPILCPSQPNTKIEEWRQTRLNRKYVDANLRFPPGTDTSEVLEMTVRDSVLELEEKLFLGCLGELKIKDRQTWRDTIVKRGYDKQCTTLTWGSAKSLTDDLQIINGKAKPEISISAYRDPGNHLLSAVANEDDSESEPEPDDVDADTSSAVKAMASALLQLGQAVLHKYLKRPLGYDEKERIKDPKIVCDYRALRRWEISLMECTSYAQIILHLIILENSIVWSKSVLNANCKLCRKKTDAENMLLCDSCNKGHHMYCLKPKLTKVPEGDWFCDQCKPKEKTPQKRVQRKVFKEEDSGTEMDDTNTSWSGSNVTNVCGSCGSGGMLIQCNVCQEGWHSECLAQLPAKRTSYTCNTCSKSTKHTRDWKRRVRRCAADAINNAHHYAKMLKQTSRQQSDSESSEETPVKTSKAKRKRISKEESPAIEVKTSATKRSRRSVPITNGFNNHSESSEEPLATLKPKRKSRVSKEMSPLTNGNSNSKRSSRTIDDAPAKRNSAPANGLFNGFARKSRKSEAFHRIQIEDLLESVMRHKDSWPFNAPVTLDEVPDYFLVIKEPMDFGTIKIKMTSGRYLVDAQFMSDSDLVFNNCFTYNQDDDSVAKAGIRLRKFFEKRCKELNLTCFPSDEIAL